MSQHSGASRVMGIQEFGDTLIRTRDLDPLYCGLVSARLPSSQLARWLLAYWCFYHVGLASWMSEHHGVGYWYAMDVAARDEDPSPVGGRWPRAAERRHFRGQKCVDAVVWLEKRAPEWWVLSLADLRTDKSIMDHVQTWPMFGPWIAFKAADMMERVWGSPVTFDPNLGLMYEEPRKGLDLMPQQHPMWNADTTEGYYRKLLIYFSSKKAPPRLDRPCGPQEVETVLCKWKSHVNGHYWVGKDIHEHREGLVGWGETAERLLAAYPTEVSS